MLTHDSGACLLQNGGNPHISDDDDEDEEPPFANQNQGVVIREIDEDEENGMADEMEPDATHPIDAEELDDIDPDHNALDTFL